MSSLDDLPVLGVGLGFRPELAREQSRFADRIDWFEVIADRYFRSVPESLERVLGLRERHPLVPHGLELSIGTDEPLDVRYCEQFAELVRTLRAPFCSDHLCMTRVGGLEIGQLTPLPFTEATAARCAAKAREARELLGVPLLLENISYTFAFPSPLGEAEFISRVVTGADCGLLLDLTNVFINSQNHGYDPYAFLDALPLDRVIQVHLAGGERWGGRWVDSHGGPVDAHPEVWGLLRHVMQRGPVRAVLIERDQNFPDRFEELLVDLDRAREIFEGGQRERSPAPLRAREPPRVHATPVPGPGDDRSFQLALTRVLVEPEIRGRFVTDPVAEGHALGLSEAQLGLLTAAGVEALEAFARDVASKRLSLLERMTPAVSRLLKEEGLWAEAARRFAEECVPREVPEFDNRALRDSFAWLAMLERMIAEGRQCRHLSELVLFERTQLELGATLASIESAKAFRRRYEQRPELPRELLLAARPRTGPHVRVERFSCDVTGLVRRLLAGEPRGDVRAEPALVLFCKAPGWRNVRHLGLNERTRRLIEQCDGSRTVPELAALLWPAGGAGAVERCLEGLRQLHAFNAVALEPPEPH